MDSPRRRFAIISLNPQAGVKLQPQIEAAAPLISPIWLRHYSCLLISTEPLNSHPQSAEAKLQRQAEAAAASSSEVLQQRVADLEERLRLVGCRCLLRCSAQS